MSLTDLMKKGSLRQFATATVATVATDRPNTRPSVASVATVSVAAASKQAANEPAALAPDPDCWCWPNSMAMNTAEIDTFTARLARFTDYGLGLDDAEALADKLVKRDREFDRRQPCLECVHLAGQSGTAWRCKNWQRAGIALRARDAQLATALVLQLKRCNGFTIQT